MTLSSSFDFGVDDDYLLPDASATVYSKPMKIFGYEADESLLYEEPDSAAMSDAALYEEPELATLSSDAALYLSLIHI